MKTFIFLTIAGCTLSCAFGAQFNVRIRKNFSKKHAQENRTETEEMEKRLAKMGQELQKIRETIQEAQKKRETIQEREKTMAEMQKNERNRKAKRTVNALGIGAFFTILMLIAL